MSKWDAWVYRVWRWVDSPAEVAGFLGMSVVAIMGIYGMISPPPALSEWALLVGLFLFAVLWGGGRVAKVSRDGVEFQKPRDEEAHD